MVKFYLSPRPDKNGDFPIRVSISIKGTRLISTVGFSIDGRKWDADKQCVKKGCSNSKGTPGGIINERLKKIDAAFCSFENTTICTPTVTELADLLAETKGAAGRKRKAERQTEDQTIIGYLRQFISEEGHANAWAENTYKFWYGFARHLGAVVGGAESFSFFDDKGLQRFVDYLRNEAQMTEATARKKFSALRWFLGWAIRKGYAKEEEVSKLRPKFKIVSQPIIFLTKDELLRLYTYKIPENGTLVSLTDLNGNSYCKTVEDSAAMAKTRDLFCFCAFTSLRYSDMAALKRTDIYDDCIHVVTAKTNDALIIELNDYARAILNKYRDCAFPNGLALPVISNQRMNRYLKDLCELCGFNEPITRTFYQAGKRIEITQPKFELVGTHCGRRTFVCYALSMGIPPQVVMKWTGHSDYHSMLPYIAISEAVKLEAMKLFND